MSAITGQPQGGDMHEDVVLRELRDLTKLCYRTDASVTVLSEKVDGMKERIAELEKPKDPPVVGSSLQMWHIAVLTCIYAVGSNLPLEKLLDLLR